MQTGQTLDLAIEGQGMFVVRALTIRRRIRRALRVTDHFLLIKTASLSNRRAARPVGAGGLCKCRSHEQLASVN